MTSFGDFLLTVVLIGAAFGLAIATAMVPILAVAWLFGVPMQ